MAAQDKQGRKESPAGRVTEGVLELRESLAEGETRGTEGTLELPEETECLGRREIPELLGVVA